MPDLKVIRASRKRSLTTQRTQLERFVQEEDEVQVKLRKNKFITTFNEFEDANKEVRIEDASDEEDTYYEAVLKEYTETLKIVNIWLKDRMTVSCSEPKIAQLLALPKLEITKFDGDPQQYLYFMSIFEETVEKVAHTDDVKRTHLLQQTTGRAHDAVKSCSFFGGSAGYKKAKQILKERFGSDYLIAEGTIRDLRGHKPAHTASAIQKLADTANAERILKSLNQLSQIDTQCTIIDIVERLSHSFRNDWGSVPSSWDKRRDCILCFTI